MTTTYKINKVIFAYDDGDKPQEVLDYATQLVLNKEFTTDDPDLVLVLVEELVELDVYSVDFSIKS